MEEQRFLHPPLKICKFTNFILENNTKHNTVEALDKNIILTPEKTKVNIFERLFP